MGSFLDVEESRPSVVRILDEQESSYKALLGYHGEYRLSDKNSLTASIEQASFIVKVQRGNIPLRTVGG